jgi:ankyrin repeat protein
LRGKEDFYFYINNTNKYDITPLILPAFNGRLEIFHYLKEINPNINITNANQITLGKE